LTARSAIAAGVVPYGKGNGEDSTGTDSSVCDEAATPTGSGASHVWVPAATPSGRPRNQPSTSEGQVPSSSDEWTSLAGRLPDGRPKKFGEDDLERR